MDNYISTLLKEIKADTGWSEARIGTEIGTSQPTINRILNGQADCQGRTWRAIQALHKRLVKSKAPGKPRRASNRKAPTD